MTTELINPHDRFFKEILSRQEAASDFLRHYLPAEVVALFDLTSLETIKDTFVVFGDSIALPIKRHWQG